MASFRGFLILKRSFVSSPFFSRRSCRLHASLDSVSGKHGLIDVLSKGSDLALKCRVSKLGQVFDYIQRNGLRYTNSSGKCLGISILFGVPLAAALQSLCSEVYCMDDNEALAETHDSDVANAASQLKEHAFWMWATKLWLPIISVLTVLMGWRHPLALAIDFALLLFTTKPSPHSVYLFIEQLSSTKKVEFQDYGLLYLAWVEYGDKEAILIGILGGWWVLHSSPRSTHTLLGISNLASFLPW